MKLKINSGVERRNRTLLDMVRSMMNLTTLPKSFSGYALESIARILNMVSTKTVERTPYEIWHGNLVSINTLGYLSDATHFGGVTGFTQNPNEPCVYLNASGSNVAFLDLGEAAYILGIKIICDRSKRLIALSQSAYLEKILMKFRTENSKKGYTPMVEKPGCRKSQGAQTPNEVQRMQRVPYASGIGSIIRFQQNPSEIHWIAIKTILKYLRNTKDMVLVYGAKLETELKVSCNADANSEYIDAAEASMEAVWMRKFIDGLGGVVPSN
ncbi:retrotransposon protein, putative, ty1-copia subclass [Tanacetum coccineum]